MTGEELIALERHQMLADAHLTMIQSIKYPETVAACAVAWAKAVIQSHQLLQEFAKKT